MSLGTLLQAAPSVKVSVDRNSVTLTTVFTLTCEFSDFKDFPSFTPNLNGDFTLISGPTQSTNYSWVNGVATSSKTLSWSIAALKPGDLTIPAFEFRDGGTVVHSRPILIHVSQSNRAIVSKSSTPSNSEPVFVRTEISADSAVPGQVISVKWRLYYRSKVSSFSFDPIATLPGFLVDNVPQKKNPSISSEVIDGINYNTALLKEILVVPTDTGRFVIPPQKVRLEVQRRASRQSIFDDPFFSSFNTQSMDVLTQQESISVQDLPAKLPKTFSGAVGDFTLKAHLDTTVVEADQAANIIVEVKGRGNLKNFTFPAPEFPSSFQAFDPRMSEDISVSSGTYSGKKTWEFIFIPTEAGSYTLPDMKFSYYSVKKKAFITRSVSLPTLTVKANSRIVEDMRKGLTHQEVSLLNEDIRYIFTSESKLVDAKLNPLKDLSLWILPLLAVLAALLHYAYDLAFRIFMNNPVVVRRRNALKNARKQLSGSAVDIQARSQAFSAFLADRMNIGAGEIGSGTLSHHFRRKNVSEDLQAKVFDVLREFDRMKFSPSDVEGPEILSAESLLRLMADLEAVL